jgi:hypothetical protein
LRFRWAKRQTRHHRRVSSATTAGRVTPACPARRASLLLAPGAGMRANSGLTRAPPPRGSERHRPRPQAEPLANAPLDRTWDLFTCLIGQRVGRSTVGTSGLPAPRRHRIRRLHAGVHRDRDDPQRADRYEAGGATSLRSSEPAIGQEVLGGMVTAAGRPAPRQRHARSTR